MKKLLLIIFLGLLWFIPVSADHDDTKAWEVDGEYLTPKCFLYEWGSSENFREFHSRYASDLKSNDFWSNIGKYYGTKIPLGESFEYYDNKLSLTKYLKDCVSSNPITHVMENEYYEAYHISYDVPKKFCKDLAPNIKLKCLDLKVIFQYKRYRTPFTYRYLYGVFEIENKEKIILILKDLYSDEEFNKFKATFKN